MLPDTVAPGDYFVVSTGGWMAHIIRMATSSKVNHAGIYLGNNKVLEAEPHGAVIRKLNNRYSNAVWSNVKMTASERAACISEAVAMEGTKYSYLTILVLGLVNVFKWNAPNWLIKIMQKPKRMVCSQMVDQVYLNAGVHLFNDGRISGLVTPGDLLDLIEAGRNG